MITWHYITSTEYLAASDAVKTNDKLFFLSDTGEIYRGKQSFTESVILHSATEVPGKAVGKLYINSATLEGKIWNGSTWTTVIKPVAALINADDNATAVSGKAVATYVSERISEVTGSNGLVANVTYTADSNSLNVSMADGSTETVPMSNVAADLVYDSATGKLQVKNAQGTTIGTGINLDLERFVSAASYDHETRTITLSFNSGDPLTIDVGDLVDTYTGLSTSTISMAISGNRVSAAVILSKESDNQLVELSDGLYVAPTDLSGKMDLVNSANPHSVAIFNAAGQVTDVGLAYGAATIKASPNDKTLATEAAVAAIRTALQTSIDGKIAKVDTGKENEIILATADGQAKTSGVKIGGETLAATPDAATIATEKAVQTYVGNYSVAKSDVVTSTTFAAQTAAGVSDTKVASEKAVFDAMTWKTTV